MGVVGSNILAGSSGAAEAYTIDQSLRFDEDSASKLSRTLSSGDRKTWTLSTWVKLSGLDTTDHGEIFNGYNSDDDAGFTAIYWYNGKLRIAGWSTVWRESSQEFRDPSAWYHLVVAFDTTEDAADDRCKIYVNGSQVTSFGTNNTISADTDYGINGAWVHQIGQDNSASSSRNLSGYLAEVYFIDGTALDASSFGQTDSATNQWIPIDASDLTFGTNGFYQKYSSTELAASFEDSSRNGGADFPLSCDYLIVAGGGGGGSHYYGGGGGAGGYRNFSAQSLAKGDYTVVVGAGGAADGGGGDSSFNSSTSTGGGQGARDTTGGTGGSGGGAGSSSGDEVGGAGNTPSTTPSQGSDGGDALYGSGSGGGGGGGGASAVGADTAGDGEGGDGGNGTANTITGSSVTYAGGGGGGAGSASSASEGGAGGSGGGGKGADYTGGTDGVAGTANTGGGGGGGCHTGSYASGKAGGSGIVIIRYAADSPCAMGGTITSYTDGGTTYQVHSFTSTGSSTFTVGGHTITANGDVANSRAQSKVGDSSIKFDGNGDYLSTNSSDFTFGGNDFTIETWIYPTDASLNEQTISAKSFASYPTFPAYVFNFATSGGNGYSQLGFLYSTNGSSWASTTRFSSGITVNSWYHVAAVRSGSTITLYVDGSSIGSYTGVGTFYGDSFDFLMGYYGGAGSFEGYMDEIRISNTARYTTTFTPSTTAFTADSNTKLLIHSDWTGGIGADSSGNAQDFDISNISATDVCLDSPSNNFATLNPLLPKNTTTPTYREGNLEVEYPSSNQEGIVGTIGVSSGKWYWEVNIIEGAEHVIGVAGDNSSLIWSGGANQYLASSAIMYEESGTVYFDGSYDAGTNLAGYTVGDVMGVALNVTDSEITFYKNNSSQGTRSFGSNLTAAAFIVPAGSLYDSTDCYNFGQDSSFAGAETAQGNQDSNSIGDFYYEPPTDYLALCSSNLASPEIALPTDHFNTVLWAGNDAASRTITGVGFNPDLSWVKGRDTSSDGNTDHHVSDSIRGANNNLVTNSSQAEYDPATDTSHGGIGAVTTDGFTLISGISDSNSVNESSKNYVAWNWKAGTTFDPATAGTVTTGSGSANATAGFSIVKYTGEVGSITVGHGLSQAPEMIIAKNLDGTYFWAGYHKDIGNTKSISINDTGGSYSEKTWNDTTPSASVFTLGAASETSAHRFNYTDEDFIAYCFHSIEGYSKVGSYTGNDSTDGTFIALSFRPALIMVKRTDTSGTGWVLMDAARNTYNVMNDSLLANSSAAENDARATMPLDFVSNGFKWRTNYSDVNGASGGTNHTYIYYAVAESPFKYSNAR